MAAVRAIRPAAQHAPAAPSRTEAQLSGPVAVADRPADSADSAVAVVRGPSPLSGRTALIATSLTLLSAILLGLTAHIALLGPVRHARDQQVAYAELRKQLAEAVAPVGQTDADGRFLALGSPVALLEIRTLGIRETVLEGTTSAILISGAGHRRDTVLPGQAGTSVLFGRRAGYGGPFGRLDRLDAEDVIFVTTGQGVHEYRVTGVRRAGDALPPPLTPGGGRLTLVTASGAPYLPSGALRVDAQLVSEPQPSPPRALITLPESERALAGDSSSLAALAFSLLLLLLCAVAAAWSRAHWGRWQTYVVAIPVIGVLATAAFSRLAQLLPNLL